MGIRVILDGHLKSCIRFTVTSDSVVVIAILSDNRHQFCQKNIRACIFSIADYALIAFAFVWLIPANLQVCRSNGYNLATGKGQSDFGIRRL